MRSRRPSKKTYSELLLGRLVAFDRDSCELTDTEICLAWPSSDTYDDSDDMCRSEL